MLFGSCPNRLFSYRRLFCTVVSRIDELDIRKGILLRMITTTQVLVEIPYMYGGTAVKYSHEAENAKTIYLYKVVTLSLFGQETCYQTNKVPKQAKREIATGGHSSLCEYFTAVPPYVGKFTAASYLIQQVPSSHMLN